MSKEKFPTENDESAEEENVLEEGMELSGELSPEAQEIVAEKSLDDFVEIRKSELEKIYIQSRSEGFAGVVDSLVASVAVLWGAWMAGSASAEGLDPTNLKQLGGAALITFGLAKLWKIIANKRKNPEYKTREDEMNDLKNEEEKLAQKRRELTGETGAEE